MKPCLLWLLLITSMALSQESRTLTNTDVLNMLNSGIGEETIVLDIEKNASKFDTSPEALIELKKAGATDSLLDAMLAAGRHEVQGYIDCNKLFPYAVLFSSPDPDPMWVTTKLPCPADVTILGEHVNQFSKIRTKAGQVGYVNSSLLREGTAPIFQPKTETISATPVQRENVSSVPGYPIMLRVLQTQQIPYSVQVGGGGSNTDCSISGSTYTTGSATSIGNYTYGNASSDTNLGMHCTTRENVPMKWRHVLKTMLAVGSNRTAYIIACDAAWRWSKCRGLITGDTFPAKMTSRGIALLYNDKGKAKEASYSILQMKTLTQ